MMPRLVTIVSTAVGAVLLLGASEIGGELSASAAPVEMVRVPVGRYRPLYTRPARAEGPSQPSAPRRVPAFDMDVVPVTNGQFLEFVRSHPQWRRSQVSRLFADGAYLRHWKDDLTLGPTAATDAPVVFVSWFAARAYLTAQGKVLPTVDQWEYAAAANETMRDASRDPRTLEQRRLWYSKPSTDSLGAVGGGRANVYGLKNLHGLVWEWTLDFNSALVTGESRADGSRDRSLYCGSGAVNASDFEDYAAFMRYAFRSSVEARYNVGSLGFRGVRAVGR